MMDILRILEKDARTSHKTLATMTGKPVAEVDRIVAEAEKSQTILKYKTVVDWHKAGVQEVLALIEVRTTPQRDTGFDAIAERIAGFAEARSVYLVSGTYDLLVLVAAKDIYEVSRFVSNKVAPIEAVTGTVTHFVLRRFKEDGDILVGREQSQRQSIAP